MEDNKKKAKEILADAIALCKQIFTVKKETFADITLADGTVIQSDTDPIAVGSAITVTTADGTTPIPDGEYPITVDGAAMLMTTVGGFVTELEPAGAGAEDGDNPPPPGGDMGADFKIALAAVEAKFETRFAALEEALKISKANALASQKENKELTEKFAKVGDLNTKMFELIEAMSNETPDPTTKRKPKEVDEKTSAENFKAWQKYHGLI